MSLLLQLYQPHQEIATRLLDDARHLNTQVQTQRALRGISLPTRQEQSRELERTSMAISIFHPGLIPGLLQTIEYAHQILAGIDADRTPEDIAKATSLRLERQSILFDTERTFRFLIGEGALHAQLVDPEVMIRQIDRMLNIMNLPNVHLGVIPLDARLPRAMLNGFVMFDDRMVLIETYTAQIMIEDQQDISTYQAILDMLESRAAVAEAAIALLQKWSQRHRENMNSHS